MYEYDSYFAIDWSGAKGVRQKGLAVAGCGPGNTAPEIFLPEDKGNWSRQGIIDFLNKVAKKEKILAGFDFSFATPFIDENAYFPGTKVCPMGALELWQAIEKICNSDSNLYGGSFFEHEELAPLFLDGSNKGSRHQRRFRKTETRCLEAGLGNAETFFHLVGASQVGKASVAGMRCLLLLNNFAIWPFDEPTRKQSTVVEIYTRVFLTLGGIGPKKITNLFDLNKALAALNSASIEHLDKLDDNITDALVSSAGLRRFASLKGFWKPAGLAKDVAKTEGWTFGVF